MSDRSLEDALAAIEREAEGAVRVTAAAHTEAKRVKAAAATGQLRALRQSLDALVRLADQAAATATEVRTAGTSTSRSTSPAAGTPRRCWRSRPSRTSPRSSPTTAS